MSPMIVGAGVFGLTGLLLVGLGVPLMRGRVEPNPLYGLRTRETLANERVWYEANAWLGGRQVWLGLGLTALAWVLPFVPGITAETYAGLNVSVMLVGVLWLCVSGMRHARAVAEHHQRESKRNRGDANCESRIAG